MDQIQAFVSVATLGGFTRASRQLHRTQPAVSRRIQTLEKRLGVTLFQRRGREVTLTPEGKTFLPYAEAAVAALNKGVQALAQTAEQALSVAVVGTLADQHLAATLGDFRQRPDVSSIQLQTATSREVSALVLRGEADVGIRYFRDHNPELRCVEVGTETLILVCANDHTKAGKRFRDAGALADDNWLSFPHDTTQTDSFGHLTVRALIAAGISEPRFTLIDSLTAQKRLVQAGFGLALLPPASCEDELATGNLARIYIKDLKAEQPIFAIHQRGRRNPMLQAFLKTLARHLKR